MRAATHRKYFSRPYLSLLQLEGAGHQTFWRNLNENKAQKERKQQVKREVIEGYNLQEPPREGVQEYGQMAPNRKERMPSSMHDMAHGLEKGTPQL